MGEFVIKKVNMIVIHVKEMERSIRFYRDVLGLSFDFAEEGMTYFSIGGEFQKVGLMLHLTNEPKPADHGIGLDFQVDDVEALVSAAKEMGAVIVQEPIEREWGVKEAVIADPDGHKLWFVEAINNILEGNKDG